MRIATALVIVALILCYNFEAESEEIPLKKASVLYPADMIRRAGTNAETYRWAADIRDNIIEAAQPWMNYSDDELWDMMFGNTISRSWMVWRLAR